MGTDPRAQPGLPARRAVLADDPRGRRDGCSRPGLLRELLRGRRARPRAVRGLPGRLRRSDARPRHERRHAPALHLLGDHHRPVVPAHRARRTRASEPRRGEPGTRGHHVRRTGDAGRDRDHRAAGRDVPALRGGVRPATERRPAHLGGRRPPARRRVHQVRADPVPLLAARRDGGPHPSERLPARCSDGEGRDLPGGAPRARLRPPAVVAVQRARRGRCDDAARRLPGVASERPEAAARLRHRQPARLPHRVARHRDATGRPRRPDDAARPRALQGQPLPDRGRDRPRDRHPRSARSVRPTFLDAGPHRRRRPGRRVDGGTAAAAGVRRQGGRLRRLRRIR